eukprot:COSAG05_NODE_789_length_7324_cov_4.272664_1_plen_30_part_10
MSLESRSALESFKILAVLNSDAVPPLSTSP